MRSVEVKGHGALTPHSGTGLGFLCRAPYNRGRSATRCASSDPPAAQRIMGNMSTRLTFFMMDEVMKNNRAAMSTR